MSISSIRQRKLFKSNTQNKNFLLRLLSDSNQSDKQQGCHLKTQQSEHRESYSSSRPTLQSSQISRQLTVLQNKVNKQEALTDRCFEQMESLDNHYQILRQKQNQKYQLKLKQVKDRIRKQHERNVKARNKNTQIITKIIDNLAKQAENKENFDDIRLINSNVPAPSGFENLSNHQMARELLEMVKFQRTHRQIKKISLNQQQVQEMNGKILEASRAEETLVLEIKPSSQQRQSQSILLDDSYTD